jgi:hypothetical protein
MAKHRKPSRRSAARRKATRARSASLTAFVGLTGVAALAVTHATTPNPEQTMLAATVTNIDGTNYPNGSTRMGQELQGQYNQPGDDVGYINDTAEYPGTLGVYSGASAPTGDQSIADGAAALDQRIKNNDAGVPGGTKQTVVCYSLGCAATTREQSDLIAQGYPTDNITFVEIADPNRPNGGILARMPDGTYIPFLGITGGTATPSGDATVTYVTQEGDGIADAPEYPIFVTSDANAIIGAVYLHGNYYDVNANDPANQVTTSPDGKTTDILVPSKPGSEPILLPLNGLVPQPILVAASPMVDSTIDPGYDRSADPSVQQQFAGVPPPAALVADGKGVVTGTIQTAQQLPGAVVSSVQQTLTSPSLPRPNLPPQLSSSTSSMLTGGNLFKPSTFASGGSATGSSSSNPLAGALSSGLKALGSLTGASSKPAATAGTSPAPSKS